MSSLSPKSNGLNKPQSASRDSIGDFIIGDKLGEGTFSKVCQGTHKITNEKVAIKIMSKAQIKEPSDKLRIEKEINIQKRLHHNCIIQQYCIIETKSTIYIITEYCSGGELFEYIVNKRKLYEVEACRIFQQLISGLEYLHKQRIVHRDLKPENLLFDNKHNLKIADFGLSNEYKGKLSTPCGSPCYAAPEMVTGKEYNGSSVDIWSSGIVLYTMVCGYLPFEDENQNILFSKIAKGLFSLPSYLSASCKDLIKSILVTDPKKRFGFEQIKHHPWFMASNNVMGKNIFFNSPGLFIKEDVIPVDGDLVKELHTKYGYDIKNIVSDVIRNKHNNITTSYYLLLKRKIRNGEKSISDISPNSEAFLNYLKLNISKLEYWKKNVEKIIEYNYKKIYNSIHSDLKENINDSNNSDKDMTIPSVDNIATTKINGGYAIATMPTVLSGENETNKIPPKEEILNEEREMTQVTKKENLTQNSNMKTEIEPTHQFSNTLQVTSIANETLSVYAKPSQPANTSRKSNSITISLNNSNHKQNHIYTKISSLQASNQIKKFINKKHPSKEPSSQNSKMITETPIEQKANGLESNHVVPISVLTTEPMPYLNGGTTNLQHYKKDSERLKLKSKKRPRSIDPYCVNNTENSNKVHYYKLEPRHSKQNGGSTRGIAATASTSIEKKKYLNTSLIISNQDSKMISPLESRINHIVKKRNTKALNSAHARASHYSQEHVSKKQRDLELACPRNNGNSFILTNPVMKKESPPKQKYTNIGKLKKFINATIHSNNTRQKNLSMPKNSYKLNMIIKEKELVANQNKLYMTICTKKSVEQIKEVVETVTNNQIEVIKNPHSKIQLKCRYKNKIENLCFMLNLSKLIEVKDYFIITPNVINGNMVSVRPLFEKIKKKLI